MSFDYDEFMEMLDKRLCFTCIGESFLKALVEKEGHAGACNYCQKTGKTFSIRALSKRIEKLSNKFSHGPLKMKVKRPYTWALQVRPLGETLLELGNDHSMSRMLGDAHCKIS